MTISISEAAADSADAITLIGELDEHLLGHPYPAQSRHAFSVEKLLREQVVFFITRVTKESLPGAAASRSSTRITAK